jgi:hypothetical protein
MPQQDLDLATSSVGEEAMLPIMAATAVGRNQRVKSGTFRHYPAHTEQYGCGLVGRAEIMAMAGFDPDLNPAGASKWFRAQIDRGMFPPHDGQKVDGKPTWRRDTMLVHLYLRRHPQADHRRYLIAELWPEAQALLPEEAR